MHLKKIELSGFKSFARATSLEFPSRVTAIVGPNGSGKSNIAEAVRWVMGEQSMKSLRGKKGEDLIWNGSLQVPRTGKASVAMIFDNKDGRIPVGFEEVVVSRKIFRDGMNEYFLNDSQVRLKDIVELLARMGLGETKHNIISQGEVDRILMATPRERRETLEEALGLRAYQLKKNEAERKLEATDENIKQVDGLLREIAPHLKFLRAQARKAETRETVESELKSAQKIYFLRSRKEIWDAKQILLKKSDPLRKKHDEIKREIANHIRQISEQEKVFSSLGTKSAEEKDLISKEAKRRELERELGRLEGRIEMELEKAKQPMLRAVDIRYIQEEVRTFLEEVRSVLESEDNMEMVRSHLHVLMEDMRQLLDQIDRGAVEEKKDDSALVAVRELEEKMSSLQKDIAGLAKDIERQEGTRLRERERYQKLQQEIRVLDNALRAKQEEERDLALQLERYRFEDERLKIQEENLASEFGASGLAETDLGAESLKEFADTPPDAMRKQIERLRGKLEEIGGIDREVVKEYEETEARHAFLSKETEDLKQASASLKELIKELDQHIKEDFKKGFSKIKEEFHNYFRIIFGGGRATLQQIDVPLRMLQPEEGIDSAGEEGSEPSAEGIDIAVDLPRKRIKGLAMLSGGERALTSIALLFAITAVNPPPFLVLDETDAALDEANSQRYAAILKELSKRTQLILVTHNRETMKVAGVLYGVTMGDDGVSKLLSLKFEDAEAFTNR